MKKEEKDQALKFFIAPEAHSTVKANLVSEYIVAWAKIIVQFKIQQRLDPTVYVIDLFSGPGIYDDGTPSTPIKVLEKVLESEVLRNNVRFWFNDEFDEMSARLQKNVNLLTNINLLKHPVEFSALDADSPSVTDWFVRNRDNTRTPLLAFIDPFGYKEINQDLLRSIIQVPQSDIIFFFNYKRVNAALDNELFESNMNRIFGSSRAERLKSDLVGANTATRPDIVNRYLEASLKEIGAKFVVSFKMVADDRDQISHYIVGLTKHEKGFELFKKIMRKHTQDAQKSQSRFGYDLFSQQRSQQQSLFDAPIDPISDLCQMLRNRFSEKTINFGEIYRIHHPTTQFTDSEYKSAVRRLLVNGHAAIDKSSEIPRRLANNEQAVPDYLIIKFLS